MDRISRTEWMLGIIVTLIMMSIAIFLNPIFKAGLLDDLRIFQSAVKIDNDPHLFIYARKTNAGNVLAYGEFQALEPVTFPELANPYAMVVKITERYTQHTRQVCSGHDKKGNCTSWRTEFYYSWDTSGSEARICNKFSFLGEEFTSGQLVLSPQERIALTKDTVAADKASKIGYGSLYLYERSAIWSSVGDLRFRYEALPITFSASVLMRFFGDQVTDPLNGRPAARMFYQQKPAEVLAEKQKFLLTFDWIYYCGWLISSAGLYMGLAYKVLDVD